MQTISMNDEGWYGDVARQRHRITLVGVALISMFILTFGTWSATAPIAGAVVTAGAFVAGGENKVVQHADGGVIRTIVAHEGQIVEQGEVLVVLENTAPKAELRRLILREARLEAMHVRLQAEASRLSRLDWPPEFARWEHDTEIEAILAVQANTFKARRANVESDVAAQRESINALEERIRADGIQISNTERQISLFSEEIETKAQLLGQGLSRKSEVYALQRGAAASSGELGRLHGDIGDTRDRIARTHEQINGIYHTAAKAALDQLHEVLGELQDVRERQRSAQAVLDRVAIVAPVRGVVVKMSYHTPGGVVEPGRGVLEILPTDDKLLIEARVRPQDIDHVHTGQAVAIRLSALNRRATPMLDGVVAYVSADAVSDRTAAPLENRSRDAYLIRISVNAGEIDRVPGLHPLAGMPVEVFVRTGDRTFLEYLVKPLRDSFSRAFRET